MTNVLRLAVIAALLMGAGAIRADDDGYSASAPRSGTDSSSTATTDATTVTPNPQPVVERGAASMEPGEGIDEDPGTGAHQAWVESIWTSP